MDRAGNPPAPLGAPVVFAGPLRIRAHVEQHGIRGNGLLDLLPAGDHVFIGLGRKGRFGRTGCGVCHRPPLGQPGVPAAVQHSDIGLAVIVQRPPEPSRVQSAEAIIGHHRRVIPNAHFPHGLRKLVRAHDMRRAFFFLEIMMAAHGNRTRNMGATIGIASITIDDSQVVVLEMRREPLGLCQHIRSGIAVVCHCPASFLLSRVPLFS